MANDISTEVKVDTSPKQIDPKDITKNVPKKNDLKLLLEGAGYSEAAKLIKSIPALMKAIGKGDGKKGIKMFGKSAAHEKKDHLKVYRNPDYYKAAFKVATLAKVLNDPEWWGGDSNKATGPMGIYMPQLADDEKELIYNVGLLECADFDNIMEFSLIAKDFDQAISNFNLQYGFETELEMDDITDAIAKGLQYAAVFLWVKKLYNSEKVLLVDSETHGASLYLSDLYKNLHGYTSPTTRSTTKVKDYENIEVKYDNINNKVWLTEYVSDVERIYLLPDHKSLLNYLFNGYFSNGIDAAVNALIDVVPFKLSANIKHEGGLDYSISLKTLLDNAKTAYHTAISKNRYIRKFLEVLGFGAVFFQDELQRDPTATAYVVHLDEEFNTALENMNAIETTNDEGAYIYQHNVDVDFTIDEQVVEIPIGALGELLKLKWLGAKWIAYGGMDLDQNFIGVSAVAEAYERDMQFFLSWGTEEDPHNDNFWLSEATDDNMSHLDDLMDHFEQVSELRGTIYSFINDMRTDALRGAITMEEFLGITDTNASKRIYADVLEMSFDTDTQEAGSYDYRYYGGDQVRSTVRNMGVDAAYVPTYYMYKALACIAYTWGHNYKQALDDFSAKVTQLKLVK